VQRLALIDRVLLSTLLPLCLVVFGLHIWSVVARDLASNAIYAAPATGPEAYPTVGGFYPESHEVGIEFQRGDRLLRVGDYDLKGVGYTRFDGLVLERTSATKWVEIEFERDGVVAVAEIRAIPYPMPWHRMPLMVSLFGVGVIVMLRGRDRRQARLVFAGFLSLTIILAQFRGGPSWITELGLLIRYLGAPIAFALTIAAMMTVPEARGRPTRLGIAVCLACALFSLLMRSSYYFEFPFSSSVAPRGALLSDVAFIVIVLFAPRWSRFPIGIPIACTLAAVPMIAGSIIPVIVPGSHLASPLHAVGYFALALIPIVLLSRIVTHRLFDVDRVLSAAATYSLLVTVAFGALLGLMPSIALGLSAATGITSGSAQMLASFALALTLIPANRWLRPRVEMFFFPERQQFALGIESLRGQLETCDSTTAVLAQLCSELNRLLRTTRSSAFVRSGNVFYECFSNDVDAEERRASEPLIDAETPSNALREITSAVVLKGARLTPFDPAYRRELTELGFHVLLPIKRSGELEGFLCLGEKGSGGDYSEVELSLLTATADRASARLEQFVAAQLADEVEAADHQSLTRSRFMAKASHDLRQPLQALSLFAGALSQRSEDAQVGDLAHNISRSTAALREMFDGLLDLSRIEVGSVKPKLKEVALAPLFRRLESELAPLAAKKGLRLRVAPTTLSIESDETLLGRILQNLILNAIRYTDRGGVVVGARRRRDSVHIEVVDTGPGISEKDRQLIFKEFERIADDKRADDGGLGLGLAIVERLAGLLGHRVELASELEAGSRFTVVASRRQTDPKPGPQIHVADAVAGLEGRAVLVIDDDASIREASRILLENWGCKVATIATVAEIPDALERLGGSVDAAIADYRLAAGETGVEAIRALRDAARHEVPAVLITGDSTGADTMQSDGLPVLSKPLAPARLRSLLVHMLRAGRAQSSSLSKD
jgi:signal transduction histidine kinase/CheY-like chemotaxis protein